MGEDKRCKTQDTRTCCTFEQAITTLGHKALRILLIRALKNLFQRLRNEADLKDFSEDEQNLALCP
jgi:hypothetical protein